MQALQRNKDCARLLEMTRALFTEYTNIAWGKGYDHDEVWMDHIRDQKDRPMIHWFELCLVQLAPKIAAELAKQPGLTLSYATYIVQQKLLNELNKTSPIDVLYDMWKFPIRYVPDL